jgi:hypothetical protein
MTTNSSPDLKPEQEPEPKVMDQILDKLAASWQSFIALFQRKPHASAAAPRVASRSKTLNPAASSPAARKTPARKIQGTYRIFGLDWLTFTPRKILPAFWTIAALISLVVNVVLIALLFGLGREMFKIKSMVGDGLLGGLYTNFQKMDAAHITTTINVTDTIMVTDTILVKFDLPLKQDTVVVLVQDTPVNQVPILLNGVWVPANIVLPQGTELGIALDLSVPVETTVPVNLKVPVQLQVPVDIAMNQTQLHEPFQGLQGVIGPYYNISTDLPSTWEDISLCGSGTSWFCRWYFGLK